MADNRPDIHKPNEEPEGYRFTADQMLDQLPKDASISNKVYIVTGSHSGIGEETARSLSSHGAKVILATRNQKSAQAAMDRIKSKHPKANLQWLYLDLSDLDTVKTFVADFRKTGLPLNGLICNAGIMASPYSKTKQGFESQFGTNHMGHFLLIKLLLDDLIKSGPGSRVVVVSSAGHRFSGIKFDDLDFSDGKVYEPFEAYGQSKTANILCAKAFNEKYSDKGVEFFSLHPGLIRTNLDNSMSPDARNTSIARIASGPVQASFYKAAIAVESFLKPVFGNFIAPKFMKTVGQGAATQVWAATSPDLNGKGGAYLDDCHISTPKTEEAQDATGENARRLYDLSIKLVAQYL
ncbi:hypothetical protein INT43_006122 [Umbelopsis isabellina]|uniref:Uncharacterized protein n=1 Tax=Mortierella isabellina TaxID=91625 RepID=A0A8H7UIM9_MORIS|nr:hypothetical protein INT43_006122 [Umbelopsis isabellina]